MSQEGREGGTYCQHLPLHTLLRMVLLFPDCISASAARPAGQNPFCCTSCKVPLPFIGSCCQPQIHPLQPHTFMSFRCAFPMWGLFPTPDYPFLIFFELKNLTDPSFHRRPETSSGNSIFYYREQHCLHPWFFSFPALQYQRQVLFHLVHLTYQRHVERALNYMVPWASGLLYCRHKSILIVK